ncbi:hypothetical protein HALLA_20820 (plasmid) [Halostagnicola larsenii XH-48]|uniref:Uncharacterized protein n=1 Tax=Halostagnicola larsenii XH-48 TaxID=797299 RepID=W0JUY3_9EURY|nr:hypothetical protein HALLA_20820 [Halostagnicola larsenii XH-48]
MAFLLGSFAVVGLVALLGRFRRVRVLRTEIGDRSLSAVRSASDDTAPNR